MAIRLPALSETLDQAIRTFVRFPLAMLSAILGSGVLMYYAEEINHPGHLWKIILSCWLGLVLFLSLTLYSERNGHSQLKKYGLQLIGVLLLLAYYFFLPDVLSTNDIIRFILFAVALHLTVSF